MFRRLMSSTQRLMPLRSQYTTRGFTNYTAHDFEVALVSFCITNNVTPDIIFPILGFGAKVFHAEFYIPSKSQTRNVGWRTLDGLDWTPFYTNIEVFNQVESRTAKNKALAQIFDRDRICIRFNNSTNTAATQADDLTKLWFEILRNYSLYLLDSQGLEHENLFLMYPFEAQRKASLVEIPLSPVINQLLRPKYDLLALIMSYPECRRAYAIDTPNSKLIFETMLQQLDKILARFRLEVTMCDILAPIVSGLALNAEYPGFFSKITASYAAQKHDFKIGFFASEIDIQRLIAKINSISQTESCKLVSYANGCGTLTLSFHYIENFVLEHVPSYLRNNPALVAQARREYLANAKLHKEVKFPAVEHGSKPAKSSKPKT